MAAAWAKDAAGTLIQASSGDWEVRAKGYDDSSSSLVKALKRIDAVPDDSSCGWRARSSIVISSSTVFVDGKCYKHPESGKTYDFVSMKRSWKTDAPERDVRAFTRNALEWLAREFWEIEAELEDLHTKRCLTRATRNPGQTIDDAEQSVRGLRAPREQSTPGARPAHHRQPGGGLERPPLAADVIEELEDLYPMLVCDVSLDASPARPR